MIDWSLYEAPNYIALAIPVFFLLIGIELWYSYAKSTNFYRFSDAVTNIQCGIGQQMIGLIAKTAVVVGYVYLYENARFISAISNVWWVWILLFFGVDFFYYWFHRLAHEINVLWGSHVVHHQSEDYNLTVALRQSWFQSFFSWIFYLPLAVIGFHPILFLVVNQFQTLYQFWIHTQAIHKLPSVIEYVLNTPSHHRVHHGQNPEYIDKNHGGTLIIFDRWFGTFQPELEPVVYGITTGTKSWNPLWVNFKYWVDMFTEISQTRGFSNKAKLLFYEPGWQPQEKESQPIDNVNLSKDHTTSIFTDKQAVFKKYETDISRRTVIYVLLQFVFILVLATFLLFGFNDPSTILTNDWIKWSLFAFLLLGITNLGGILDQKRWTFFTENFRWMAGILIVLILLNPAVANFNQMMFQGFIAISIISLVWFNRFGKKLMQLKI